MPNKKSKSTGKNNMNMNPMSYTNPSKKNNPWLKYEYNHPGTYVNIFV